MPAATFKRLMQDQSMQDTHDIVEMIVNAGALGDEDAIRLGLQQAWMSGALWALKEGHDRAESMITLVAEQAIAEMSELTG